MELKKLSNKELSLLSGSLKKEVASRKPKKLGQKQKDKMILERQKKLALETAVKFVCHYFGDSTYDHDIEDSILESFTELATSYDPVVDEMSDMSNITLVRVFCDPKKLIRNPKVVKAMGEFLVRVLNIYGPDHL